MCVCGWVGSIGIFESPFLAKNGCYEKLSNDCVYLWFLGVIVCVCWGGGGEDEWKICKKFLKGGSAI